MPKLPDDTPMDWSPGNSPLGEAGGQGEVYIIYYKGDVANRAAIKIYPVQDGVRNNIHRTEHLKERRMRAHRELVALKELQGTCFQKRFFSVDSL